MTGQSKTGTLAANSYGKSRVRISQVTREADRHVIRQLIVETSLEGDFAETYLTGDNRKVVATDSMKNTVNVFARELRIDSIEEWCLAMARHFVATYPQVAAASVRAEEEVWQRMETRGAADPFAFVGGGSERPWTKASVVRGGKETITSGLDGLLVLKTTKSAFKDFVTDRFRTLSDTEDRIFSTVVSAEWHYSSLRQPWNDCRAKIRAAMLETFADHMSWSVQETLLAMGQAALAACDAVSQITFELPNKHHIPVDLRPFGLDNPKMVCTPTDEPYGLIKGTVVR